MPNKTNIRTVDLVMVDGDMQFLNDVQYLLAIEKPYKIDTYNDPHEFLCNLHLYSKWTNILVGNLFKKSGVSGVNVIRQLVSLDFVNAYLFSNFEFDEKCYPYDINFIRKTDINAISTLLGNI
jgi:hypothetical protein